MDIELTLSVELGRTRLPLGDILEMGPGSVITLNRMANEPLDVRVSQLPIMKAEVIAIGENYGIRIVETKLETDKAS
nr:flagellar motor switch protein FliN [Symbiobacterium terraclitae]